MTPSRGEIWLIDFGDPIGREAAWHRPALILSDDILNHGPSGVVVVIPLTTTWRGLPSHVEVDPEASGLDDVSYARCEDIRSLSTERLVARLGRAPVDAVLAVERSVRFLLGL